MAIGTEKIADLENYNRAMSKSMIDKMFFMDKIDESVTAILDYGCADGVLISTLAGLFPQMTYIGYDLNPVMIQKAQERCRNYDNVYLFSSLQDFRQWTEHGPVNFSFRNTAVNLSSLIHEVYSYGSPEDVEEFWSFIVNSGFGYIVIRDMCLDHSAQRPSLKEDILKVKSSFDPNKLAQFEAIYGPVSDNRNLIHFLLKYRYEANWEREVRENYLPVSVEDVVSRILKSSKKYQLIYFDHYILPFIARSVKKDFDIILKDYTHVKFIYELQ